MNLALKRLSLARVGVTEASVFVARLHRHNRAPRGGVFAVGCWDGEKLVGVAIVGRPVSRAIQEREPLTCECTRNCTDGTPNACSFLYGAAARAARSLGFTKIITYTLASEPGTSLRAAGWEVDGGVRAEDGWSRPSREREDRDLFGAPSRPVEAKVRWRKLLT